MQALELQSKMVTVMPQKLAPFLFFLGNVKLAHITGVKRDHFATEFGL